jgi:hypothetical protein
MARGGERGLEQEGIPGHQHGRGLDVLGEIRGREPSVRAPIRHHRALSRFVHDEHGAGVRLAIDDQRRLDASMDQLVADQRARRVGPDATVHARAGAGLRRPHGGVGRAPPGRTAPGRASPPSSSASPRPGRQASSPTVTTSRPEPTGRLSCRPRSLPCRRMPTRPRASHPPARPRDERGPRARTSRSPTALRSPPPRGLPGNWSATRRYHRRRRPDRPEPGRCDRGLPRLSQVVLGTAAPTSATPRSFRTRARASCGRA